MVSSLWLEYPLELLTWRLFTPLLVPLPDADDFAVLRDENEALCFRDTFEGEFSEDDDDSRIFSEYIYKSIFKFNEFTRKSISCNLPRCDLNFVCFNDFAEHSLSDSDPNVSYSVIGMWSERILRTSESVEPGLSDSRNCMSCASSRSLEPVRRTFVYSGSFDCKMEISMSLLDSLDLQLHAYSVIFTLIIVIDERATNRMIWSTVDIATVWTFTIRVLVELKCCIWTQIFNVF